MALDPDAALTLLLVLTLVLVNLPFVSPRVLVLGPSRPQRALGWRLLELLALGLLALGVGMLAEAALGQRHAQGWAFYVTWLCLLLTFAFPGFAWRYLRRQHD